ncbi:MAG: PAS domain S-box protein [Candidatus Manganitrophus sp.]|nr:PAS domain S-box protein [Candidatus Manganitrophus sp.]
MNKDLEQRVVERTKELAAANEALKKEVAERRRAEDALRLSEERFRKAFDRAPIGMTLTGLDGRWIEVNHAFCQMVGYSEQELVGMNFRTIMNLDDLEANLKGFRELLNREKDPFKMEKRFFHKRRADGLGQRQRHRRSRRGRRAALFRRAIGGLNRKKAGEGGAAAVPILHGACAGSGLLYDARRRLLLCE